MSAQALTPAVRALINAAIDSVAQLEILLLLRREPGRAWSPESVAAELRMGAPGMRAQLEALRARGLAQAPTDATYRFNAGSEHAGAAGELAEVYAASPVAVITAIYSKPAPDLRNFADAFRLRRPAGEAGPPPTTEGGAGG
jgi:hypothetical protein